MALTTSSQCGYHMRPVAAVGGRREQARTFLFTAPPFSCIPVPTLLSLPLPTPLYLCLREPILRPIFFSTACRLALFYHPYSVLSRLTLKEHLFHPQSSTHLIQHHHKYLEDRSYERSTAYHEPPKASWFCEA
jgi:hypothetical protein